MIRRAIHLTTLLSIYSKPRAGALSPWPQDQLKNLIHVDVCTEVAIFLTTNHRVTATLVSMERNVNSARVCAQQLILTVVVLMGNVLKALVTALIPIQVQNVNFLLAKMIALAMVCVSILLTVHQLVFVCMAHLVNIALILVVVKHRIALNTVPAIEMLLPSNS
jgi:hypothetical protein